MVMVVIMIAVVIIILTAFVSPVTVLLDLAATFVVTAKDDDVRRGWRDDDHTAARSLRVARAAG